MTVQMEEIDQDVTDGVGTHYKIKTWPSNLRIAAGTINKAQSSR